MLELIFIILAIVVGGYCLFLVGRLVSFTLKSLDAVEATIFEIRRDFNLL